MDLALRDRVALVTGSYRGTGRGIARVLAAEGATVLVHGFETEPAEVVVRELREAGGSAHAVAGDIRTGPGADEVAERALAVAGRVDVLVNNYGVAEGRGWLDGDDDDWLDLFHKNVLSGVRLVRALLPGMKDRGFGRVVFVSTIGATRPRAAIPHYYAGKAGLVNMAVSLAQEVAGTGITVNTVSPGLVATDEMKELFLRRASKRGWGDRWEDVAERVATESPRSA